jgi:hypothetical protein
VALWNAFFEVERVEQPTLIARLPPHHHPSPSQNLKKTESQLDDDHEPFFNSIDPTRTLRRTAYSITSSARARIDWGTVRPERLDGLEVDKELESHRLLHWKIAGLRL